MTFHNKSFIDLFNKSINISFYAINPLQTNYLLCDFSKSPYIAKSSYIADFYLVYEVASLNLEGSKWVHFISGICNRGTLFLLQVDHQCSHLNLVDFLWYSSCNFFPVPFLIFSIYKKYMCAYHNFSYMRLKNSVSFRDVLWSIETPDQHSYLTCPS